jgi:hypothetical protein
MLSDFSSIELNIQQRYKTVHSRFCILELYLFPNFLKHHGNQLRFEEAKIFNPKHLQEFKGKFKGNPFRTFVGKKYLGGLSDHFPVYGVLSIKKT